MMVLINDGLDHSHSSFSSSSSFFIHSSVFPWAGPFVQCSLLLLSLLFWVFLPAKVRRSYGWTVKFVAHRAALDVVLAFNVTIGDPAKNVTLTDLLKFSSSDALTSVWFSWCSYCSCIEWLGSLYSATTSARSHRRM